MKKKNRIWIFPLIIMGIALIFTNSCKKEDKEKNSGFASVQEFIDNQYIKDALNAAGITIYEGTTPPNIEGEYNTNTSTVYAASSNLSSHIGIQLNTIFKFFNQTSDGKIQVSEKGNGVYSEGQGSFISGNDIFFTIWLEASNSDGSTSVAVISGKKLSNGDLELQGLTVITENAPTGLVEGDWWAYSPKWTNLTGGLTIGQNYQGGKLAYVLQPGDPGYDINVLHGLIAAPYNQSSGINWYNGSYSSTGATGIALGTGSANTNTIVASQGAGSYAAKLCFDLVLGGYSDWFLPSKDELNKLYINNIAIGGFASSGNYWSSSEYAGNETNEVWYQRFINGNQSNVGKNFSYYVRAVRAF